MGYDLIGSKPATYFGINNYGWSTFRDLMIHACMKEVEFGGKAPWNNKEWIAIADNSNKKVEKDKCLAMAKLLRKWYEERPPVDAAEKVMNQLRGNMKFKRTLPGMEDWGDIGERDERVEDFITFLEECEGFKCC